MTETRVGSLNWLRLELACLLLSFVLLTGCHLPRNQQFSQPLHSPHYPIAQTGDEYLVLGYGSGSVIDFSKGMEKINRQMESYLASAQLAEEKLVNKKQIAENGKTIIYWPYLTREYWLSYGDGIQSLEQLAEKLEEAVEKSGGRVFKRALSGINRNQKIVLEIGLHLQVLNNWFSPVGYRLILGYPPDGKTFPGLVKGGKVAIIIDDLGYNASGSRKLFSLRLPLTAAVLPGRPYSIRDAERAKLSGFQVILHQPMEPLSPDLDPGFGVVTDLMTDQEISATVKNNLRSIPHAVGINNHMGSKGTGDERVVNAVLRAAKEEGVFFLDSRTNSQSVVSAVAGKLKLPSAENMIFLDNQKEVEYIKNQVEKLIELAEDKGQAIGIGHVHPATVEAISEMIPRFEARKIELIYVQDLTK